MEEAVASPRVFSEFDEPNASGIETSNTFDGNAIDLSPETTSLRLQDLPIVPLLTDIVVVSYSGEKDNDGRFHGEGKAVFFGGHQYEGSFRKGMLHGFGTYKWSDGLEYAGDFTYNQITGRGKYCWPDKSEYEGEVKGGLRHGYGRFTSGTSECVYEGDWVQGKRHGNGTLFFDREKQSFYQGDWVQNYRDGHGVMQYASGNKYEGSWENDMKNGLGTMHWFDTNERYSGNWVNDLPNGEGEHVWMEDSDDSSAGTQKQMCNIYRGAWVAGKRHGMGNFFYANGAQYTGSWENNAKSGYGIFIFEDGRIYAGPFENDHMVNYVQPGRITEDVQPQLRLRVHDILPGESPEDDEAELHDLEKLVLRHNSSLKHLYKRFSSKTTEGGGNQRGAEIFTLTLGQFWALCRFCEITSPMLPLAEINRIFFRMRRQHALELDVLRMEHLGANNKLSNQGKSNNGEEEDDAIFCPVFTEEQSPHDPARSLLFREFVELLVRIANERSAGEVPRPGLVDATKILLEDHISSHVSSSHSNTNSSLNNHGSPNIYQGSIQVQSQQRLHTALWQYRDALMQVYTKVSGRRGTITHRQVLNLLKAADFQLNGNPIGLAEAQKMFLKSDQITSSQSANVDPSEFLCKELIFQEFMEVLESSFEGLLPKELFKPRQLKKKKTATRKKGRKKDKIARESPEPPEEDPLEDAIEAAVKKIELSLEGKSNRNPSISMQVEHAPPRKPLRYM